MAQKNEKPSPRLNDEGQKESPRARAVTVTEIPADDQKIPPASESVKRHSAAPINVGTDTPSVQAFPDFEREVLARALISPEDAAVVVRALSPECFYDSARKAIYKAIDKLVEDGSPVAVSSIADEVRGVTGAAAEIGLILDYPPCIDIAYTARKLKYGAARRKLWEATVTAQKLALHSQDGAVEVMKRSRELLDNAECILCDTQKTGPEFQVFGPDTTCVRDRVTVRPVPKEPLLTLFGSPFMRAQTVAALVAAGGTGKTTFLSQAASAWTAGKPFAGFHPSRRLKILLMCFEDDDDELNERLWKINDGKFPTGLYAIGMKGRVGPILGLNSGVVTRTENFKALHKMVGLHCPGLDMAITDPKSRIYGLDENNNDHNTAFVSCLENISVEHHTAALFSHHVSKNVTEIDAAMARGGSALIDAVRSSIGMVPIDAKEAKALGIPEKDRGLYIKYSIPKINHGPKQSLVRYMKFGEDGLLSISNPMADILKAMKLHLCEIIANAPEKFTIAELLGKNPKSEFHAAAMAISSEMASKFDEFKKNRLEGLINTAMEDRILTLKTVEGKTRPRLVLVVEK